MVSIVMVFVLTTVVATFIVVVGESALDGSALGVVCSGAFTTLARGTGSAGAVAIPDSSGIGIESAVSPVFFASSISGFFRNASRLFVQCLKKCCSILKGRLLFLLSIGSVFCGDQRSIHGSDRIESPKLVS